MPDPTAPSLDDAIAKGEAALNTLFAVQIAAAKAGKDGAAGLQDQIADLRYKLTQLRGQAITATAEQIAALNAQLDKVTAAATSALTDLGELSTVIGDITAAAKLADGLIKAL